ncbi:TPA: hypothetical protein BOS_23928 [Bos taurus]|nr:TPA: hypothetical protein BOS_23928 [Bos taurus]
MPSMRNGCILSFLLPLPSPAQQHRHPPWLQPGKPPPHPGPAFLKSGQLRSLNQTASQMWEAAEDTGKNNAGRTISLVLQISLPHPTPLGLREAVGALGRLHLPLAQAGVLQNSEMYFPALKT